MSDHHKLAMIMFADTISGRMLRRLCLAMVMPQADFLSDYMRRCARKPTKWCKPNKRGELKANPSSFANNFGRFVTPHRDAPIRKDSHPTYKSRNMLVWVGPRAGDLIASMSDADLARHEVGLERQMLAPKATDSDERHESAPWLAAIRNEIVRRASVGCQIEERRAS